MELQDNSPVENATFTIKQEICEDDTIYDTFPSDKSNLESRIMYDFASNLDSVKAEIIEDDDIHQEYFNTDEEWGIINQKTRKSNQHSYGNNDSTKVHSYFTLIGVLPSGALQFVCGLCRKKITDTDKHAKTHKELRVQLQDIKTLTPLQFYQLIHNRQKDQITQDVPKTRDLVQISRNPRGCVKRVKTFEKLHGESPKTTQIDSYKTCKSHVIKKKLNCGKVLKTSNVVKAIKEKYYKCKSCPKFFDFFRKLKEHIEKNHPEERPFSCEICNKTFTTEKNFQCHQYICHKQNKKYSCNKCKKVFNNKYECRKHEYLHEFPNVYQCKECEKNCQSQSALKQHMMTHTGSKPHVCNICDKRFSLHSNLLTHLRIHENSKSYKCKLCDKSFNVSTSLKQHILIHENKQAFKCPDCPKTFNLANNLSVHREIHANKKSYICQICKKGFNTQTSLWGHRHVHDKEPAYVCQQCGSGFHHLGNLKRHKFCVHGKNKPFTCEICSTSFGIRSHLNRHLAGKVHLKKAKNQNSSQIDSEHEENTL